MKLKEHTQTVLSLILGIQIVSLVMADIPPFLKAVQRTKLEDMPPGLLVKIPSREKDILRLTPRRKHLKPKRLLRRLSKDFDSNFMSIERPKGDQEGVSNRQDNILFNDVHMLNFTIADSTGNHYKLNDTMVRAIHNWLVQYSSCPVYYRWEDLGILFWPRWIKRGFCVSDVSCSWPPGMNCIPAEHRRIKILRWHCRLWRTTGGRRKNKRNKRDNDSNETEGWAKRPRKQRRKKLGKRCKWVKVPYPITDECYCSC